MSAGSRRHRSGVYVRSGPKLRLFHGEASADEVAQSC